MNSNSNEKRKLRSDSVAWLLGNLSDQLPISRIPTRGDVIRYFLFLKQDFSWKRVKHGHGCGDIADVVVKAIMEQWQKAAIPTMRNDNIKGKLNKLFDEYRFLQKSKGKPSNKAKEDCFLKSLNNYFLINSSNALQLIRNDPLRDTTQKEEDISFLKAIMEGEIVKIAAEDKRYSKKVIRKNERAEKELKRKLKNETETLFSAKADTDVKTNFDSEDDGYCDETCANDPDFSPKPSTSSNNQQTVSICLPKNPFKSRKISQISDRLGLSLNQRTGLVASILVEGGGCLEDFSLSRDTIRRTCDTKRSEIAYSSKSDFIRPEYCVLHWDGKLMKVNNDNKVEERLAILISGFPNCKEGKLLGVPNLPDSKGESLATYVFKLTEEWGLLDNIIALCFDTTASNSGWENGACVRLEKLINRKLLFLACRHHIFELIESAAWKSIFGQSMSPDNLAFKEFKENWKEISTHLDQFKVLEIKNRKLKTLKEDSISFLKQILSQEENILTRGDYRECAEVLLIILGENPPRGIRWQKPGAFHKARWMSTIIYAAKMFAFSEHMNYDSQKVENLKRICLFNSLIFIKNWLNSPKAADAPQNDLKLWHSLNEYCQIDETVAEAALATFNRHFWYLTEEVAAFSVFSKHVADPERKKIASTIMKFLSSHPQQSEGVPRFPNLNKSTTLTHLIGPNSRHLFDIFKQNHSWLKRNPSTWEEDENYKKMKDFVANMKVVNDVAERGVKLMQDFSNKITTSEEQRQNLLLSVEENRKMIPNFKRSTLNNSL